MNDFGVAFCTSAEQINRASLLLFPGWEVTACANAKSLEERRRSSTFLNGEDGLRERSDVL